MGCTLQLGCPGNTLFVTGWVWAYWTHPGYQDLQAGRESKWSQQGAAEDRADPPARAGRRGAAHPPASSLGPFLCPSGRLWSLHGCPDPETWVPPSLGLTEAGSGPCPLVS